MKMRGWTGLLILLLAGLAQAVNTTVTLNDKGWLQSQQGLIGYVESSPRNVAEASDPNLEPSGSDEGVLSPMLENEADLPAVAGSDPTASPISAGGALAGQPADGLINGNASTDFLDASSKVPLPAFADIDWVATPLPTVRKTSIMEVVVFPALGLLVLILLVTGLVLRIRRKRPLNREQQLLRV